MNLMTLSRLHHLFFFSSDASHAVKVYCIRTILLQFRTFRFFTCWSGDFQTAMVRTSNQNKISFNKTGWTSSLQRHRMSQTIGFRPIVKSTDLSFSSSVQTFKSSTQKINPLRDLKTYESSDFLTNYCIHYKLTKDIKSPVNLGICGYLWSPVAYGVGSPLSTSALDIKPCETSRPDFLQWEAYGKTCCKL